MGIRKYAKQLALGLIISICFQLNLHGVIFAESMGITESAQNQGTLSDITGHWAEEQLNVWLKHRIIGGYPDGTFRPTQEISRAEFFALVNRAFNYNKITASNYTDVSAGDWFLEEIGKAEAAGYLVGYADSLLKPNQEISRQEVAGILTKILALEGQKDAVQLVRDAGYMIGYPDGSFQGEKPPLTVSPTTGSLYMKGQIIDVTTADNLGQRKICQDREILSIDTTDPTKTIITVDGAPFTTEVGYLLYHVGQRGGGCDTLAGESGMAPKCPDKETEAIDGMVSVSYRGMEDLWGNVYEFIDGIKYNNATREPYVADHDFTNSAAYLPTGITLAPGNGFATDFAFSEQADWLLMPGEAKLAGVEGANYNTYIADYYYQNWAAETERVTIAGGGYTSSQTAGIFYWTLSNGINLWGITQSTRLLFIP